MALRKATITLTADVSGEDELVRALPGKSPYLVYRIDVDDSDTVGSGDISVTDENGTVLSAGDPTTSLEEASDLSSDQSYRGIFAGGPFTSTITAWDEDDVVVITVFYDSGGIRD